ncbi:hypothetical protein MnTg03_00135 [bacterium MnTg03]|nr:hypothetical protein MnTg03_00135 [bacterium MnTg03]
MIGGLRKSEYDSLVFFGCEFTLDKLEHSDLHAQYADDEQDRDRTGFQRFGQKCLVTMLPALE